MIKHNILAALLAFSLGATGAMAAEDGAKPKKFEAEIEDFAFSFEGPFGKYEPLQLQRGLQVYTEVCAACHGLRQVAFRNLGDPGGPQMEADQVKAFAKLFDVADTSDDAEPGDTRPGKPADKFPANTDAGAPDLSLMAKARAGFKGPYGSGINQILKGMGGAEYVASMVVGYTGEEKEVAGTTLYENTAFESGGWTAMPPPMEDGQIEFRDGAPNTVEAMAEDVAAFLMWTAEPKLVQRKRTGFLVVSFMILLTSLLYLTNKKLWAPAKRKDV
ncbi:MAG: cytochrome c1 [Alphaproteobacteria bacterium]|nr:cytochrome c1 [Alphaproteobacteria bacterium]